MTNDAKDTCAVREARFPESITQLRSFLGACNVYLRFVKDYSKIASPLSDMLQKNGGNDRHNPTEEQLSSFEELKARLTAPPILALPKANRPYMIDTDASAYAIGAVLLQQQDENYPTSWATVGYWSKTLTKEQLKYSATECECYAVVCATLTLRLYIESTKFVVHTAHNALRWMMTTNDPQGRLMRWRLRLMEFDYEIVYHPGRVHTVPDALSRLIREDGAEESETIDEEIPSFGDQHQVQPESTHSMQVVTSARSGKAPSTGVANAEHQGQTTPSEIGRGEDDTVTGPAPADLPSERECLPRTTPLVRPYRHSSPPASSSWNDTSLIALPDETPEVDDTDDLLFDLQRLVRKRQQGGAPQSDKFLPTPLSKQEIMREQKLDDFGQAVHTTQLGRKGNLYFEDEDGMLCRRHPRDQTMIQAVLPSSLRHRLLRLAHQTPTAGHPGQTRLDRRLQRSYYWPHMAADTSETIRECTPCAKNRLRLLRKASEMKLFPATAPLDSVAIDILGPLPKIARGYIFMLVIFDRFTKLTQVVPLKRITAYDVAVAFVEIGVQVWCASDIAIR